MCFIYIFPYNEILYNKNYRYKSKDLESIFNKPLLDKYIFTIYCFMALVFLLKFIKENYFLNPKKIIKKIHEDICSYIFPFVIPFKIFNFSMKLITFIFLSFNFWYSTKIFYHGIGLRPNSIKEGFLNYLNIPKFKNTKNEKIIIEHYSNAEDIFQKLNTNYSYGLFRVMTGIGSRPELEIYFNSKKSKEKEKINFLYKQSYDKNLK